MYKEPKYRTLLEAEPGELERLREKSKDDPWKPLYHIHPQFGLMNDPNGLAYFNGEYHVFYQWYPFGPTHGMKHWAHVKSKDLAHWERLPIALIPIEEYESHGAYSGASLEVDGKLYLYYTGNIKYDAVARSANQNVAIMDKNGEITKYENNPLIEGVPEGYTGHVRDPKVFKRGERYYMLLGAQRENLTGAIIVYESGDALDWTLKGELNVLLEGDDWGYMWECPDVFEVDGKDVLVFSPQGLEPEGHAFHNVYNVIYLIGSLDTENLTFTVEHWEEIDKGFDFYAPQTFASPGGKRVLFSWAGSGEVEYPSDENLWAHCLSIPRELSIRAGRLIQQPAEALKALRAKTESGGGGVTAAGVESIPNAGNAFELELTFNEIGANQFGLDLFRSGEEQLRLQFDKEKGVVSLDRTNFKYSFGEQYGTVRSAELAIRDEVNVRVFVDRSIAEVFINDGELVFTARVFPQEKSHHVTIFSDGAVHYQYELHQLEQGISL